MTKGKRNGQEECNLKKVRVIKAWAIINKHGELSHHDDSWGLYQFKCHARAWMFSDDSEKLVQVEIHIPTKKRRRKI